MILIKCNLCGSERHELLFRSRDRQLKINDNLFNIVKCRDCGLVFINPQPEDDELKKYYPASYGPYQKDDAVFKYGFFSRLISKVVKSVKKSSRVAQKQEVSAGPAINYLDFGCGGGEQMEAVRRLHPSWNLCGLDNSAFACANTEKKGFKVFCGDALTIDLPRDFFDIVNMNHVVEHLRDPMATIEKIRASLKAGGKIVVSTPNFDSLAAKIFKGYWYATDSPRHLTLFTPQTLARLLKKNNFFIRSIEYDKYPKVEIRSFYYLFGKNDLRISPILWNIFRPVALILSLFGKTSNMKIVAEKIKT